MSESESAFTIDRGGARASKEASCVLWVVASAFDLCRPQSKKEMARLDHGKFSCKRTASPDSLGARSRGQ